LRRDTMNTKGMIAAVVLALSVAPRSGSAASETQRLPLGGPQAVEPEAQPVPPGSLGWESSVGGPSLPDSIRSLVEEAVATDEPERRKALLLEAERIARAEIDREGADAERRYALAITLGARANTEGGKAKIRAAAELREELESILEMDPQHAGAHHLLGRLHAAVQRMSRITRWVAINLLGGSALEEATWAAAEEHLAFAEAAAPGVLDHHLQLALLYRDTKRPELALREIEHLTALQASGPVDRLVLAEAMEVRAKLSNSD